MKGISQTLQTVLGVGPMFIAGIIAEIDQIERFANDTKIAKYAGIYWRKHQSGRFTTKDTSLSRKGNQYLRYYLVEAVPTRLEGRYLSTKRITLKVPRSIEAST